MHVNSRQYLKLLRVPNVLLSITENENTTHIYKEPIYNKIDFNSNICHRPYLLKKFGYRSQKETFKNLQDHICKLKKKIAMIWLKQ